MESTVKIIFDGEEKTCKVTVDRNGEYLCESEDGRFVKFPAEVDLTEAIAAHNEVNNVEVEYAMPDDVYNVIDNTKVYA